MWFVVGLGLTIIGIVLGPIVNERALSDTVMYHASSVVAGIGGALMILSAIGVI